MSVSDAPGALYVGRVGHTRLKPRRHSLRYRVFMLLVDIDRPDALDRCSRWLSLDRFNLLSFHPSDYGDKSAAPLRQQIHALLDGAGIAADGGAIRLLTLPRVLGFVFNPLSVYFCHRMDGTLAAIVYEVSSTFGRRHSYVAAAEPDPTGAVRQSAEKRLHVSPLMDMELTYDFRVLPPDEEVLVDILTRDREGPVLTAYFAGARRPIDDRQVVGVFLSHPLLTLKIVAGIHVEAVRTWLKGVKLRPEPPDPEGPMTVGRPVAP